MNGLRLWENIMKRITLLFAISLCIMLFGCQNLKSGKSAETTKKNVETTKESIENCKYIKVKAFKDKNETYYIYTVYDKNGKKIYQDSLLKDPSIEKCGDDVYCVQWGTGTGVWQSRFFDINKIEKSEIFNTNYDFNNNRTIIYDLEEKRLKVKDIFDEDCFYREFKINTNDSTQPVLDAKFIDDERIKVKFLTGKDYKEDSKVLYLNKRLDTVSDKEILKVLNNKKKLYNTKTGKLEYLKNHSTTSYMVQNKNSKYKYSDEDGKLKSKILNWTEIDLDGDNKKEVVLELNSERVVVLRSYEGKVYCYQFTFRGMKSIKKDGTFESSGSAVDTYIGKLYFKGANCYYDELIAYDEWEKAYRINKKSVSKTKAKKKLKEQDKKEGVDCYEWKYRNGYGKN